MNARRAWGRLRSSLLDATALVLVPELSRTTVSGCSQRQGGSKDGKCGDEKTTHGHDSKIVRV